MTTHLYLSRVTLQRDATAVAPLLSVLAPANPDDATAVSHRLMWTLMPDDVRRSHDKNKNGNSAARSSFLWRAEQNENRFYVLGPRPVEESPFFLIETKPFEPELRTGDRLSFTLRVNATVDRKIGADAEGAPIRRRSDVAMDLMQGQERDEESAAIPRADRRNAAAELAARNWLQAQGNKHGFAMLALALQGYRTMRLPRRGPNATIGVFDTTGLVEVRDPEAFLEKLSGGFGRAKAFGCGLMLIRRAP